MSFDRGLVLSLLRRPTLLLEALRAGLAMRSKGGVAPAQAYIRWRLVTAYGDEMTTASAHDLLSYLQWRREMRTIRKWERVA